MEKPKHSPWGEVQTATLLAEGIYAVTTIGHGGIKVSPALNKLIPDWAKESRYGSPKNGWYEEDCDWCIPLCFLAGHIRKTSSNEWILRVIAEGQHKQTLQHWHPAIYERLYTTGDLSKQT